MGAACGERSRRSLARSRDYGAAVGLAFQVVDDILDVTQFGTLGKTAGKDAAQQADLRHCSASRRARARRAAADARRCDALGAAALADTAALRALADRVVRPRR